MFSLEESSYYETSLEEGISYIRDRYEALYGVCDVPQQAVELIVTELFATDYALNRSAVAKSLNAIFRAIKGQDPIRPFCGSDIRLERVLVSSFTDYGVAYNPGVGPGGVFFDSHHEALEVLERCLTGSDALDVESITSSLILLCDHLGVVVDELEYEICVERK